MQELTTEQKKEVGENWNYFKSIHADLFKTYPMVNYKWIVVMEKKCIDIFATLEEAIEKAVYRSYAGNIFCIIQAKEKLQECSMSDTHFVAKQMIDRDLDFGPFKPVSYGTGFGHWIANEKHEKESYPVKEVFFVNMTKPILKGKYGDSRWVSVKLVGDEDNGITYLGLYLGDVANTMFTRYDEKKQRLVIEEAEFSTMPFIYVPKLNRCVLGVECWWGNIKDPKKIRGITRQDLNEYKDFLETIFNAMEDGFKKEEKPILKETENKETSKNEIDVVKGAEKNGT